ncbi:hypothetical protein OG216_17065 [Streptomycetaceae bacterium NBC_01309]
MTTSLYAVVLGVSVTACGSGGKASDAQGGTASSARPTASATVGGTDAPSKTEAAGDGTNTTTLAGKVAAVRTKAGKQQTYKSVTVMEYDGELSSKTVSQVRSSDLAQRTLMTMYPAAYVATGLPGLARESTSESLIVGMAIYSKLDPGSYGYDAEKPWSKSTLTEPIVPTPESNSGTATEQSNSPLANLDKLIDSGEIRVVGQEVVDGLQTTHYAGTISVLRILEDAKLTSEAREQTRQIYELMGMDNMALDLWVGPDDLPVKQVSVMPVKLAKPVVAKTTVTYSDWGKPIDLTPPPASQVEDLGVLPPLGPKPTGSAAALPSNSPSAVPTTRR